MIFPYSNMAMNVASLSATLNLSYGYGMSFIPSIITIWLLLTTPQVSWKD